MAQSVNSSKCQRCNKEAILTNSNREIFDSKCGFVATE